MKRFLALLLLIPQLAYSQYQSRCFQPDRSNNIEISSVGIPLCSDTTILLNRASAISGFVVTGQARLDNFTDSYIRITLKDSYNYEFLVYENYPMLSGRLTSDFANTAMETIMLNDITPQSLKVETHNATLRLDSYGFISAAMSSRGQERSPEFIQREQTQFLVDQLNSNLKQHNQTWRAKITSISEKSYEEKKSMFGGSIPELYGFEHYAGGIFVLPASERDSINTLRDVNSNQYVSEWDWRNRHGKNWMSPVKNQGSCGSCWAFSAVGAIESYANLYYNRQINFNLSEQELISCAGDGCNGGDAMDGLEYIVNNGIVSEDCFPYAAYGLECNMKCSNPSEIVSVNSRQYLYPSDADALKSYILKCPLSISVRSWEHALVLAGYKTLTEGDTIYFDNDYTNYIILNSSQHGFIIGRTAWLMKNSWGTGWGTQGYGYILSETYGFRRTYRPLGGVSSLSYSDNDILCVDEDGDGFYTWGMGPRPSTCPSWAPDTPDGDDSNYLYGPIDQWGNLQNLSYLASEYEYVSGNVCITSQQYWHYNIVVQNGAKLTVTNTLQLHPLCKIIVQMGGELEIDGSILKHTELQLETGSILKINNSGKIIRSPDSTFSIPLGASFVLNNGSIE